MDPQFLYGISQTEFCMAVRGKSTLVDSDGNTRLEWIKEDIRPTVPEIIQACKSALVGYKAASKSAPVPKGAFEDTLTFYPVSDLHFGQLCWGSEIGKSWDLNIAERELNVASNRLLGMSPPSKFAIILGGGDAFHADNSMNETPRGHNKLDVDGRWPKAVEYTCRYFVTRIDAALRHHEKVLVRILPGNHDPHSSVALAYYLNAWYRNEPRVEVSTDPSMFWWYRYGKVLFGATHGHTLRANAIPGVMAARRATDWGKTEYRYFHRFHVHHGEKTTDEGGGCIVEAHTVAIPKSAWEYERGFLNHRSMCSITYDKKAGEIARSTVNLEGQG